MEYKIFNIILFIGIISFQSCAEKPEHTNIFDPYTPNDSPSSVTLHYETIDFISNNSIHFSWNESGAEDFFRYTIIRSTQADMQSDLTLIKNIPYSFWTSVIDTGLSANTDYYYKVIIEDKGGLKTESNILNIQTAPNIHYVQRFLGEGTVESRLYLSKMDVVQDNTHSYVIMAGISKAWDLELIVKSFPHDDEENRGSWQPNCNLIVGDSDGDGEPDLYEIIANYDPSDSENIPSISYVNYPIISPMQVVAIKDELSTELSIFVLCARGPRYWDSVIFKFVGDLYDLNFTLDPNWYETGFLRLFPCYAIEKYSNTELLIGAGREVQIFDMNGKREGGFETVPYLGVMSVGRDIPTGTDYIYMTTYDGTLYKYDVNGTLHDSWIYSYWNSGYLSPVGLFADQQGRILVTNIESNAINVFNSNSNFISGWYGINTSFIGRYTFDGNPDLIGQASISGDNLGNIFIIDLLSIFSRATF